MHDHVRHERLGALEPERVHMPCQTLKSMAEPHHASLRAVGGGNTDRRPSFTGGPTLASSAEAIERSEEPLCSQETKSLSLLLALSGVPTTDRGKYPKTRTLVYHESYGSPHGEALAALAHEPMLGFRKVRSTVFKARRAPTGESARPFCGLQQRLSCLFSPIRESVRLSRGFQQPFSAPFQESSPCLFSGTRYLPRPIRESARPLRGLRGRFSLRVVPVCFQPEPDREVRP